MARFNIYPSILDAFQGYLDSSEVYQKYYGMSEDAVMSEEEFSDKQYEELINKINRVPFESEAADKGTAFNEVIDCILLNKESDKMEISSVKESRKNPNFNPDFDNYGRTSIEVTVAFKAIYKEREFIFPAPLCLEIAQYYNGAIPQFLVSSDLQTKYGTVNLYGYIDYLLPFTACDLKTTSKYEVGKYRKGWQRFVYLYCLNKSGNKINEFEFNATDFKATFTELYTYNEAEYEKALTDICERFIEFMFMNEELITDKKIILF